MSFIMRCDACNRRIDPEEGESFPKDKTTYVELQTSDDPNRRRHYHRRPECWGVVRDRLLAPVDVPEV